MASGLILLAGLSGMSIMDLVTYRISNSFILGFMVVSLILASISGLAGLLIFFSGLITGTVLFIIPYCFGMIGGADVKIFAITGSFLGIHQTIDAFLYTLIAGLAIVLLYKVMNLIIALKHQGHVNNESNANKISGEISQERVIETRTHIAYIPAILIGAILSFNFPLEYF